LTRALDSGRTRWLLLSAAFVGLAFNTKDLQAYLVVPALVATYLLFGPASLQRRLVQLCAAGAVLLVSSGWWMTIVDLIPASSRPYIGGSTDNSVLNLVLGYNGLGRIFGESGPAGGGPGSGGGAGFGGQAGLLRLFNSENGGQISWLLPLAAIGLAAGIWARRREPRVDMARAAYVMWGGWLLTHFMVFSFATGIFHAYYTVAMAPAIAALVGAGLMDLWRLRSASLLGALIVGAALLVSAWWGGQLLARTPDLVPGLATIEVAGAVLAAAVLVATRLPRLRSAVSARVPLAALVVGTLALLLGPGTYAIATTGDTQSGAIPSAGPTTSAFGRPGGFEPLPGGGQTSSQLIAYLERNQGDAKWLVAVSSAQAAASLELATGRPVMAMGGFSGGDPAPTLDQLKALVRSGQLRYVLLGGGPGGAPGGAPPALAQSGGMRGSQAITQWVQGTCTPVTVAGTSNLYDCAPAS
jgi:4-amino-4-deoxy-L-arabinose transferase-like glycosyltransferase